MLGRGCLFYSRALEESRLFQLKLGSLDPVKLSSAVSFRYALCFRPSSGSSLAPDRLERRAGRVARARSHFFNDA
jgi:hypothetical protein